MCVPEGVDEVKLWELVEVEDPGGEAGDQDVRVLVEGGAGQVVELALLVEEMPGRDRGGFSDWRPPQL